jgi:methyl-accepting chemotaxis protein
MWWRGVRPVRVDSSPGAPSMFSRLSLAWKLTIAAGTAISVLLLTASVMVVLYAGGMVRELSERNMQALAEQATADVTAVVGRAQSAAEAMTRAIGSAHAAGVRDRRHFLSIIEPQATIQETVLGSWFMEAPGLLDGADDAHKGDSASGSNSLGQFVPYYVHIKDKIELVPLDTGTDYEQPFYTIAAKTGKPAIMEPYTYEIDGKPVLMTTISFPVYSNGTFIGVGGLDMALDDVSAKLGSIRPFGEGYAMLLSAGGAWVAHPDPQMHMKPYADGDADAVKAAVAEGRPLSLSGLDIGGTDYERVITPASLTGLDSTWAVVVDVPTDLVAGSARMLAIALAIGALFILALVVGAVAIATNRFAARPLAAVTGAIGDLSAGQYDKPVQGGDGGDEIGAIARALEQFRHELAETRTLRAGQETADAERRLTERERASNAETQAHVVAVLAGALRRLASGDLTGMVDETFPPEYEALKRDYNQALERLASTMTVISGNTRSMRSGAGEISQAADDLARRTERQAASLEETAATLKEITTTVARTAEGARQARELVSRARTGAEEGGSVVRNAVSAMDAIAGSSRQVGQIIGVIDEIAFQTNLLALNAGVEAARAGEAGRGFAVVASEVRALAQRSADAAKQIKGLITNSASQVNSGVGLVAATGGALERILQEIAEINTLVGEIAGSAEEQASGVREVNAAVGQMDQVTQQNAAMVEESTAASHALADQAQELERLVGQFRTPETATTTEHRRRVA